MELEEIFYLNLSSPILLPFRPLTKTDNSITIDIYFLMEMIFIL